MRDPLYELLAFKVLSLGVLRHERMRQLCVANLRFFLRSTVAGLTWSGLLVKMS
jgi:hypothetical protein